LGGGIYVIDASVLIDYQKSAPHVLRLISRHLGRVIIPRDILREVNDFSDNQCLQYGLEVMEATVEEYFEAADAGGALSFQDWVCLLIARRFGATCITNDNAMHQACRKMGFSVIWGLRPMLTLVEEEILKADEALNISLKIHANNRYVTEKILKEFRVKLSALRKQ
jgi:predicted nucleic acid-binding protein